jgi:hypothetical protein
MIPIVAGLLMGAAMGGGIAALQKKDILQGALMGGVGGALGGAFMPGVAGAAAGETVSATAAAGNPGSFIAADQAIAAAAPEAGIGSIAHTANPATTGGFSGFGGIGNFLSNNKYALAGGALGGMMAPGKEPDKPDQGSIREFSFNPGERNPLFGQPGENYYTADRGFTPGKVTPVEDYTAANGGIIALAEGGQTDRYSRPMREMAPEVAAYNAQLMERANAQYNINPRPGPNQVPGFDFKPSQPTTVATETTENKGFVPAEGSVYADLLAKKKKKEEVEKESGYRPYESWASGSGGNDSSSNADNAGTAGESSGEAAGEKNGGRITQRYNMGGISSLGTYSDGGQLLKGPGDGVSDDIPAQIGARQPARLADGEFVVPARVVSELGNGSTDAGAKRLYAMMDRVQKNRRKSVGKGKVAVNSKAYKHLPA